MNLKRTLLLAAVCFVATISSATTNLIYNGDFEEVILAKDNPAFESNTSEAQQPDGWVLANVSGNFYRITSKAGFGIDGSRALDFKETNDGQLLGASQEITVKANTDYTVSYYAYYPAQLTKSAKIAIRKAGDNAVVLNEVWVNKETIFDPLKNEGVGPLASNTDVQHSFEFNSGEHTQIALFILSNKTKGRVYFDNFRMVEKTGTDITQAAATDAIRRMDNTLVLGAEITSSAVYNLAGANMNIAVRDNKMDISALPQGIYVVRAKTAEGTYVAHKFVK